MVSVDSIVPRAYLLAGGAGECW